MMMKELRQQFFVPNLQFTCRMTPKQVTSAGAIYAAERLGNTARRKCQSVVDPLATVCRLDGPGD